MAVCETFPLLRDTTLDADRPTALSEPVEVGPFRRGVVFVRVDSVAAGAAATVDVGISPTGYEDWDAHWTPVDRLTDLDATGVYAARIENFGNWLRLRPRLDGAGGDGDDRTTGANADGGGGDPAVTVLGWFVGKE